VLPFASLAEMVMLNAVPAVCVPILLKTKWSRVPALTLNKLLVPEFEEPNVLIVVPELDAESETEPVQTPPTNAEVLTGLIVPEDAVRVLVPA
jgi:hypothetical protein